MMIERHYSPRELAKMTGFPESVIYDACKSGQLEHVRFGKQGHIFIAGSAMEQWRTRHVVSVAPAREAAALTPLAPKPRRRRTTGRLLSDIESPRPSKRPRYSFE